MNADQSTAPGRPASAPGIDVGFLRRVHLTGVALSLLISLLTAFYVSPRWGLGFLCASLWSVTNLWVLERLLRAAVRPSGRDPRTILLAGLVKIPILYALLLWMLAAGSFPTMALLTGMGLPLLVIVLKVLGRMVVKRGDHSSSHEAHPVDPS